MDNPNPISHSPSQQLAKYAPAEGGEGFSSYLSQLTGNPFFTAVRLLPLLQWNCTYHRHRVSASQRSRLQRASVREVLYRAPRYCAGACLSTSKSHIAIMHTHGFCYG